MSIQRKEITEPICAAIIHRRTLESYHFLQTLARDRTERRGMKIDIAILSQSVNVAAAKLAHDRRKVASGLNLVITHHKFNFEFARRCANTAVGALLLYGIPPMLLYWHMASYHCFKTREFCRDDGRKDIVSRLIKVPAGCTRVKLLDR